MQYYNEGARILPSNNAAGFTITAHVEVYNKELIIIMNYRVSNVIRFHILRTHKIHNDD